jgi:hypothetical protein
MANQAIALQARAPQQANFLSGAIQQSAQMMNMMSQQRAAERQAAQSQQAMEIARAEEGRKTQLHGPAMDKARFEALSAEQKSVLEFLDLSYEGIEQSRNADDVVKISTFLKQRFPSPVFGQMIDQTLADMPSDPALFSEWKQTTKFETLKNTEQLAEEFTTQNLGGTSRIVATPKYGGGAARVVEGSEAPIMIKPQGMNVEGVGPGVLDPETNTFYPAGMGATSGYTPPRGPMSVPRETAGGGSSPVKTALQTNPGALKDGPFARSQPGYAGASGGFATFNTPEEGILAQENLLRTAYVGKGFNTIDKIVNRYAPPGPENSAASVANYKQYIAQRTGLDITAPITAAQVPAVAAAMREFETGNKPGRGAAGAPAPTAEPKTVDQAQTEKAFKKVIAMFGYDPATGKDTISPLISASTSGGLEKFGSDVVGFVTGEATPGRVALNQLEALKDSMTFEKLRGKLGAQISNADVQLVANTMADIANPDKPANARLAAWQNVVLPILLRGAGIEPPKKPAAPKDKRKPLDQITIRRGS